jgi:hypothetical protein
MVGGMVSHFTYAQLASSALSGLAGLVDILGGRLKVAVSVPLQLIDIQGHVTVTKKPPLKTRPKPYGFWLSGRFLGAFKLFHVTPQNVTLVTPSCASVPSLTLGGHHA